MKPTDWQGVMPAITTPFRADLTIDFSFLRSHCSWLVESGCTGIVALGSLGESATLAQEEKIEILKTCIDAVGHRAHVIAGVSALSTAEAVSLAQAAQQAGCSGLMVLPPYVYRGDWRETKTHVAAVFCATDLSCMLYNNPIAYTTDFLPPQVQELAGEHPNLHAIKESSADVRRITALRGLIGDRLRIFCGVDDAILESVYAGAVGWIAGLANPLPKESVELFQLGVARNEAAAFDLYSWFLPLLRMDTVPKFVQLIKLVQESLGVGAQHVRPPRLPLIGGELEAAKRIISNALETRPQPSTAAAFS
jgi:4-hydroxy-tetrahydrodipicolinate synthase